MRFVTRPALWLVVGLLTASAGVCQEQQKPEEEEPPAAEEPAPARRQGRILLPGDDAYSPPPSPEPKQRRWGQGRLGPEPKQPEPTQPEPKASAKPEEKAAVPSKGALYWTGPLRKNVRMVVNEENSSGDRLPGVPVSVRTYSAAVEIIEHPSEQNDWSRIAFRALRSSKEAVTVSFEWFVTTKPAAKTNPGR